jgi:hypothetical protein
MKPKNIRVDMVYDASFAPFGQNSQSGTVLCIDRSPVGWSSAKQQIVELSSAEAEYVAISSVAQDTSWLTGFLEELEYHRRVPVLETGSASAKALASKDTFSKPTRHIRSGTITLRMQLIRGSFNCNGGKGKIIGRIY